MCTQVVVLLALSYSFVFFQFSYVVWNLVQMSPESHASTWSEVCHTDCCVASEGYYVLFMCSAFSMLRFAEPLLREVNLGNGEGYNRVNPAHSAISHSSSIVATIAAASFFVTAILLQMFASFGRFGADIALLVPVPWLMLLPILFVVRVKSGVSPAAVWANFNCFLPAMSNVFCITWPLALHHREFINETQCLLTLSAVCLLLASSRATVYVIDGHVLKADAAASGTGAMQWQF